MTATLSFSFIPLLLHPTACHEHDSPAERYAASSPLAEYYTAPLFEFWFDSTRSFIDLLASGTVLRFPHIRWIISHCGNTLPSLLDRLFFYNRLGAHLAEGRDPLPISEEQSREAVRQQFWFDLAGDPIPNLVDAVLKFTGKDRLMWGLMFLIRLLILRSWRLSAQRVIYRLLLGMSGWIVCTGSRLSVYSQSRKMDWGAMEGFLAIEANCEGRA